MMRSLPHNDPQDQYMLGFFIRKNIQACCSPVPCCELPPVTSRPLLELLPTEVHHKRSRRRAALPIFSFDDILVVSCDRFAAFLRVLMIFWALRCWHEPDHTVATFEDQAATNLVCIAPMRFYCWY